MTTETVSQRARTAALEAEDGVIQAARALSSRDFGASQSEMREARKYYLTEYFATFEREVTAEKDAEIERLKADEFNRGVLIAASTLIDAWGHGTETAHLLKMIDADAAMVERMGFDDFDRVPLLAALATEKESG